MKIAFTLIGILLFTVGVAFVYWPASLICLGLLLAFIGIKMEDSPTMDQGQNGSFATKPDYNSN